MKDSEIIKALKLCNADKISCDICPLKKECDSDPFYSFPAKYALDIINRQKAEIKNLNDYNENLVTANTALSNEIIEIKSEAIKEFSRKLKKKYHLTDKYGKIVTLSMIDKVGREMVKGQENE